LFFDNQADSVQSAITRKNARIHALRSSDSASSPGPPGSALQLPRKDNRVLRAEDFAVEILSKEQLLRDREIVEAELQKIVGWTGAAQASDSMAPKDFLQRIQTEHLQLERESAGASAQRMIWSTWITGNRGTGKTKFAEFLSRYLRAYGAADKNQYVERTASDLRSGNVVDAVRQAFSQAAGGVLFIDEAHDMCKADADTGAVDSSAQKLQSALLSSMDEWEGRVTVVLAGYKDLMTKLMGSSQALENKFRFHIHIDDYTTAELVQIMEQYALTLGFAFEDGLNDQLVSHLNDSPDSSNFNVRSVLGLVQRAIQDNRDRMFKAGSQQLSTNSLSAADFHLGGKLGADEDRKSELDREIEDLIGMKVAKDW
jgi:Cdc6-like AAA superfamily ATPase